MDDVTDELDAAWSEKFRPVAVCVFHSSMKLETYNIN